MFVISKVYTFSASHRLPDHRGKCRNLHGHNYRVEIGVRSYLLNPLEDPSSDGMVLDFDDLDQIVKPLIEQLDHKHLNDVLLEFGERDAFPGKPPTAEVLAATLSLKIARGLALHHGPASLRVDHVRVWETEKAYAEWRAQP